MSVEHAWVAGEHFSQFIASAMGSYPGALIIDRNVLGWRLDPTCPHRIAEADTANRRMIIVCNEGYRSSLAAASLRQLGIERATDLVVGFHAWKRFSAHAS
jgi:rhodanese-related sulfurtransferase